ncbi:MAG: type II toxin-antitoxin system HicB family antitoxin [Syntrophomonadaceae bacterium]|nr:type II toxin-antitoxin system HicB family antitoxin [Syntrophomonadaceae bacterium]
MAIEKDFNYYISLPYKIVVYPSPEGGYAIEIPELPGCLSQGETIEEATLMIEDAKRAWIDIALQDDDPIPEPDSINNYSGKLNIRIPKSLHKSLAERAKQEKVSLNQFILHKLSVK